MIEIIIIKIIIKQANVAVFLKMWGTAPLVLFQEASTKSVTRYSEYRDGSLGAFLPLL